MEAIVASIIGIITLSGVYLLIGRIVVGSISDSHHTILGFTENEFIALQGKAYCRNCSSRKVTKLEHLEDLKSAFKNILKGIFWPVAILYWFLQIPWCSCKRYLEIYQGAKQELLEKRRQEEPIARTITLRTLER